MLTKTRKNKPNIAKSRKQLRKEQRKNKKIRRNEYYTNRRKPGQFVLNPERNVEEDKDKIHTKTNRKKQSNKDQEKVRKAKSNKDQKLEAEEVRENEMKKQRKLQKEMNKQRNKQLMEANLEEDRNIKHLEKQLKLNKRKSKSVPTSFSVDGLDYLLEVCDPGNMQSSSLSEQQLTEVNDEFEEDLALMTENTPITTNDPKMETDSSDNNNLHSSEDESLSDNDESDNPDQTSETKKRTSETDSLHYKKFKYSEDNSDFNCDSASHDDDDDTIDSNKSSQELMSDDDDIDDQSCEKKNNRKNPSAEWEDIYGRLRADDGSIINISSDKYVPPAVRIKMESTSSDEKQVQKLDRLKKQLKGLLNRLAESNMHNITTQIEGLYMNNSRNDMNNAITSLIIQALVSNVSAPERLLMEHIMLVAILHANVGTEVGAHFLQTVVKQFDGCLKIRNSEGKILDNIVIILSQLYNFKLFDAKLIYEVLDKLTNNFEEKNVECILHILRNVGFNLRKDSPVALKNLILNLQKQAANVSDELKNNSRVKFMLDVLLAIKNNNVSKIPNYDTTYSEHLKKIMKGFIRKGNYVSQLNISLEDLLKVEEKGRWWVVGSAWSGNATENKNSNGVKEERTNFSQKLLEMARKQRMNTDTRKNIFCIIMSAEDYLDAFEKLLRLALKNQQDREIIHVILHCCLQETKYNPFYAVLAQKFCEYDRKYQMTIKYSIWDKLKSLKEHSATQIANLAKLLSFLFMEKGLPISTLKVVQFSELDKVTLRFMRQILLGILLHDDLEACKGVFEKLGQSDKLKMFRESLKLFIYHFLLRNLKSQQIPDDQKELLQERAKIIEKLLTVNEIKIRN